ncbi:MAG: hypothetical protein A3E16_04315, partial [Candidatus Blackburnbacteria bacterium RIFCSPHIGHO2_12_FULL_44_25]
MSLPNISTEDLQKYQEELQRRYNDKTISRRLSSLRRFFDWAEKKGHVEKNPLNPEPKSTTPIPTLRKQAPRDVSPPGRATGQSKIFRPLTPQHPNLKKILLASGTTLSGLVAIVLAITLSRNIPTGVSSPFVALRSLAQQLSIPSEARPPTSSSPDSNRGLPETGPTPSPSLPASIVQPPTSNVSSDTITVKSIKGTGGLSITTEPLSDGDIIIAPDGEGSLNILSSTTSENSLNISNANLTTGNLISGQVGNNSTGFNLLHLSSGSTPTERFSVDARGNTYVGGQLTVAGTTNTQELSTDQINLNGDLKVAGVTRLNSRGRLASVTGYYQDSGLFEIDQGPPDFARITKTPTKNQGSASTDVLTLTLDETNTTASAYDTLVLERKNAGTNGYALDVRTGDINLGGNVTVGGNITASSGTLNVGGALTVSGATTLSSTLTVTGATTLSSTLSVTGTSTFTGNNTFNGRPTFTKAPTSAHTGTWAIGSSTWNQSDSTIYINPASATADSNLLGLAVGGSVVFDIDAEGDIYGKSLILTGTVSSGTTTITGDLAVEGNTTIGDASSDTLTINTSTITLANLTASRALFTNSSSNLTTTAASSALSASLSDETGTGGVAVFSTSPQITTSITTDSTTFALLNTTATTLSLGGAATTALNLGNGSGNYTAINLGSGTGTHTINLAGTGATGADTINIGTGGTGADTITIGSSASSTSLALTSGTGSQTFTSSVATGATTSSAFVFTDSALTSGTLDYLVSSSITTGRLLDIATSGNTWTGNGTTNGLINLASTSTAGTGSSSSILLNLSRSGTNSNATHTAYGVYSSVTDTGTTSTNVGGYFTASGATNNYAAIFDSGNVGIGTTTPGAKLAISQGTASTIGLQLTQSGSVVNNNDNAAFYILDQQTGGTAFRVRSDSASAASYFAHIMLNSATASAPALTVDNFGTGNSFIVNDVSGDTTPFVVSNAGDVGIGTATPGTALDVIGASRASTYFAGSSGNTNLRATGTTEGNGNTASIYFQNSSGTTKGRVDTTNTQTVGGTGNDGACSVSGSTNVQTGSCAGRATADAIATAINSTAAAGSNAITVGSCSGINGGDEVILIQMIGTGAGAFESKIVSSCNSTTLNLTASTANAYTNDGSSEPQVVRVPQYTTVTVNSGGTMTVSAWSGTTGGVLFFRASTSTTVASGGIIDLNGTGLSGGSAGSAGSGGAGGDEAGSNGTTGSAGSAGSTGTGSGAGSGGSTAGAGGPGGVGQAQGGGGGSGMGGPGGGGSYGSAGTSNNGASADGGAGGRNTSFAAGSAGTGGSAGSTYGTAALTTIFAGSGGGGGAGGYGGGGGAGVAGGQPGNRGGAGGAGSAGAAGGTGGGVLYIGTPTYTNSGTVRANGATGSTASTATAGTGCGAQNCHSGGGGAGGSGGGGGAGGSIFIQATTATLGTTTATGGTGGTAGVGGAGGTGGCCDGDAGGGGGAGSTGGAAGANAGPTGSAPGAGSAGAATGGTGGDGRVRVEGTTISGSSSPTASTSSTQATINNGANSYGTLYIGSVNTSSADLAEYYITGDKTINEGDVVTISNTKVLDDNSEEIVNQGVLRKSYVTYEPRMVGVISTSPGLTLGSIDGDSGTTDKRVLALAGRVPVKVNGEGGPINIGDYLTSSSTPGVAMKATRPGPIVAIA